MLGCTPPRFSRLSVVVVWRTDRIDVSSPPFGKRRDSGSGGDMLVFCCSSCCCSICCCCRSGGVLRLNFRRTRRSTYSLRLRAATLCLFENSRSGSGVETLLLLFTLRDLLDRHDAPRCDLPHLLSTMKMHTQCFNELLLRFLQLICIFATFLELRTAKDDKDHEHHCHHDEKSNGQRKHGVGKPIEPAFSVSHLAHACDEVSFTLSVISFTCDDHRITHIAVSLAQNVEEQHRGRDHRTGDSQRQFPSTRRLHRKCPEEQDTGDHHSNGADNKPRDLRDEKRRRCPHCGVSHEVWVQERVRHREESDGREEENPKVEEFRFIIRVRERRPRLRSCGELGHGVKLVERTARGDHHLDTFLSAAAQAAGDRPRAFERIDLDVGADDVGVGDGVGGGTVGRRQWGEPWCERHELDSTLAVFKSQSVAGRSRSRSSGSSTISFDKRRGTSSTSVAAKHRVLATALITIRTCCCCSLHRELPTPPRRARERD